MSGLHKKVRIGKYAVPVLLLATILIGTASAAAYVILQWTISLSISDNPRVHFYNGAAANTMDIDMNIFPDIRTIDENITDWDIRSVDPGNIRIRVSDMDTADVAEVVIKAYKTGSVGSPLFTVTWLSETTTWSNAYLTEDATDYHLWIEVLGAGTAAGTAQIKVDIMVENP